MYHQSLLEGIICSLQEERHEGARFVGDLKIIKDWQDIEDRIYEKKEVRDI